MRYVKATDGVVDVYPYNRRKFKEDHPHVSIPANPTADQLAEYGVYIVQETNPPADDINYNVVEVNPQLVNGVWTQTWQQNAASAEEIAARQAAAATRAARVEVANDGFVQTFVGMTPAAVDTYIDNNVVDLPSAIDVLKKMARMLLLLARKEYSAD